MGKENYREIGKQTVQSIDNLDLKIHQYITPENVLAKYSSLINNPSGLTAIAGEFIDIKKKVGEFLDKNPEKFTRNIEAVYTALESGKLPDSPEVRKDVYGTLRYLAPDLPKINENPRASGIADKQRAEILSEFLLGALEAVPKQKEQAHVTLSQIRAATR